MVRVADDFTGIDIATVVYEPELLLLKLQARSIVRHFAERDIGRIFIIVNELAPEGSYAMLDREVLPEYGHLLKRVEIVPMTRLMRPHVNVSGWRTQQALKLLISRYSTNEHYLLLDAKNHFIRQTTRRSFIDSSTKKMRSFKVKSHGSLADYLTNCLAYFGFPTDVSPEFILPATTPYIMSTALVREMIDVIEAREGMPFDDFFHLPGQNLTEFFLYFAFLLTKEQPLDDLFRFGGRNSVSLFTRWPNTPEQLAQALEKVQSESVIAFGLHKNRIPLLEGEFESFVEDLWVGAGLFEDNAEAAAFLDRLKAGALKRTVGPLT